VDTEVQPTKDAAGTLIGFMEIGTDVTARKRDQQKLADMSDRMKLAIEGSSDGLWDWMDIHEDAQWRSPSYYTMLGFTPEEMPPSSGSYIRLLHPDSIAASLQAGRDAFEGVRPFEVEIQLRTKLQGYRWFRTRAKVYRDAKGNPVRMSGATQDVHERKLAEAQAQKAASILRNSIEALDDAFVLFDENDRLVMCNQRYREFYPESAVMMQPGNSFEDIVRYGAERGQYDAAVGRVDAWVADRLALHRQEHSRMQQSIHGGRTLRVVERRMPDGYTVGFRVDVSDLVKATEAAEDASRSKSQFLANMSHEIRTPMNAILGLLKLLQNTELTLRQQDYASKTEGAARSLLGLLNDILDFSKVEAGKMTLDPRPFRIDGLMRDLSVILSANVGEKDVEVLFDVDPALPKALIGDDMRLQQVLINLGGNAIKFTAQGVVVVRLRVLAQTPEGVSVEFSVSDSGIGIAAENQAQIFSGFSQAEANTTRRFGGTGLGLAISSRLTALMGGELKVESTLGVGSTFHFQIHMPVAPQIEPVSVMPVVSAPVGALRTLVVDDNPVALDLLQQMVQSLGWPVDAAASGAQALAMVEKGLAEGAPYRAIFMDWQMPHMDGWRTSQRIRALTLEPPLIMMVTAHGREMLAQRSAADQAMLNGFLVKPVTASMLFDAIQDALQANALAATGHNPMAPQAVQKPQRLLGMRLLVVEDNKINQMVAQGLLSQEGASVTLADDGQRGVDAVANAQPGFDVVLMDLQMPVMDGYTATRAIRQQLGNNTLPIIAMTANAMASDRAACLAAGMNDHVGKPFELDHLVALLLRYSGRTTAQPAFNGKPETPAANFTVSHAPGTLDMDAALNRLGGDTEILGQALQSYVQEIVTVSARVAGQLETGELQACARVLHTLKGLSATVGAIHLAQVAAQLESRCKTQLDVAERADVLSALQTAVQATVQSLEPVLTQYVTVYSVVTPENGENAAVLNEATFRQDLQVLQGLLQNFDMLAQDAFARIRKDHGPALGDALEPLGTAIGLLAFEDAARISAEMLARGIG
jgi:signal transduction histidine kinase/CheY-like chemotaxis protein